MVLILRLHEELTGSGAGSKITKSAAPQIATLNVAGKEDLRAGYSLTKFGFRWHKRYIKSQSCTCIEHTSKERD